MTLGPVMIDLVGTQLSAEEKEMIRHPLVGGLIYFSRNFESREQIQHLTAEVKSIRNILIGVDHEGGRVQRFRKDFSLLPACRKLGYEFDNDPATALQDARTLGWLMAAELRAVNIDFSFAPVLDIDNGKSAVIGNRAFHEDPKLIVELASAYMDGMHAAGMATTGKHFPGHGTVAEDSHLEMPVDHRSFDEIESQDLIPFITLSQQKKLDAVMPAHVIYERVDSRPAGFSETWIKEKLRSRYGFDGVVFSDDLNMAAAGMAGDFTQRASAALTAGCDMALVCNNRNGAIQVLDQLKWNSDASSLRRLHSMLGKDAPAWEALRSGSQWADAVAVAGKHHE